MSMNGLLPGLSKRWPGTIGSCQYSTRRPLASVATPAASLALVAAAAGAAGGAGVRDPTR
jgi:hypothetical protein